ncbi:hypothetical protein RLEG3_04005 (plasmid) [Rhizobium leguminosarum bv. trifolii WSM1689]|nr:hypothetical protein RLEG3_04005 [Rhizobium leguminosarum bv. trifolii WSM1689]
MLSSVIFACFSFVILRKHTFSVSSECVMRTLLIVTSIVRFCRITVLAGSPI